VLVSADGPAATVIDVTSDDVARGIACRECAAGTLIEGFTITGGDTFAGAGILIEGGAPRVRGNVLLAAVGGMGGGMHVTEGATPEIEGNLFDSNQACCGPGGALLVQGFSAPVVVDNVFTGNSGFGGGAVAVQTADGVYERNEFIANTGTEGAGLAVWSGSPVVRDNVFRGNHSTSGGGAIAFRYSGSALLERNLIVDNVADGNGGGILVSEASPEIVESTIVGNSANEGGGMYVMGGAAPRVERSIVAFNEGNGGIVCGDPLSTPTFGCLDVYGNEGGGYGGFCSDPAGVDGNVATDPLLCDVQAGNYAPCDLSPCAPGNHPDGVDCGTIGAFDVACECEPTVVDEASWGAIKALFR